MLSLRAGCPADEFGSNADRVVYYSNRYIVTGEGHVRVRLSDGTMLTSELFSMDLKLNRYLLAGDVHIDGDGVHEVGAGFAGYPDFDRSYFLSATKSRQVDLFRPRFRCSAKRASTARRCVLHPRCEPRKAVYHRVERDDLAQNERPVSRFALIVLGVYIPTGKWVQTFSANPNYCAKRVFRRIVRHRLALQRIAARHFGSSPALQRDSRSYSCRSISISCGIAIISFSPSIR